MKLRWNKLLPALASVAIIAVATWVLYRELSNIDVADVGRYFAGIPMGTLLLAGLYTAGALLSLALYEVQMLHRLRPERGWRRPFLTALIAYPIGHAVGFGAFSGGAVRYRVYAPAGLQAAELPKLILLSVMPYGMAMGLLAGVAMLVERSSVAAALGITPAIAMVTGGGLLVAHAVYLWLAVSWRRPLRLWKFEFELPGPRLTGYQYLFGVAEVLCAATVLYTLLPAGAAVGFVPFIAIYVAAVAGGAISGIPAGLGVFESILLVTLPDLPAEQLLGAALAYRFVYQLIPLVFALLLLIGYEAWSPASDGTPD